MLKSFIFKAADPFDADMFNNERTLVVIDKDVKSATGSATQFAEENRLENLKLINESECKKGTVFVL